ncbi:MAG: DEAD/DEAH box helicase [Desulfobulbaceae bacterium]|uniref:DEAD/DEAH box helicase n=1 Tax=Candidatus Desulfatifera sulfidica TaxID=2841691 RepID=A0A8J6NAB3_9BACT|nr:DEAD/DEAH box helicase [Candidatus Desulfatifera sulfidica]
MKETAQALQTPTESSINKLSSVTLQGAFTDLRPELQRAVTAAGYTSPTPIQVQSMPYLLDGRDLIGTAQTGTGKTAAFVLPLLQRLAVNTQPYQKGTPRALILAPTRELAAQIGESIGSYGQFLRIRHTTIFGGVKQFHQVRALNRGVDILVATPGRLLDLMQQGFIKLNKVEVFVLDEVDCMLDMGFLPDIKRVLVQIPSERQTLFFSATMAPKMEQLARTMVCNPAQVTIAPEQPAVDRIVQKVLFVANENKNDLLVSVLGDSRVNKAIVFTQMKHVANRVVDTLQNAGIHGAAIHGNKSQGARIKALDGFKRGDFRVLVATDVAARGLDVDDITHVINYDLPMEAETYVHRIGRTARAGAEGDAISFCSAEDRSYLRDIERLLGTSVDADEDHAYHSEAARQSTAPAPKNFGRRSRPVRGGRGGRGGGGGGGRPRGAQSRKKR